MALSFKIELNAAQTKAFLTVTADLTENFPSVDQILEELKSRSVLFGIDHAALESLVQGELWGQKIEVASGVEPLHGEDGWIEYYFDAIQKPRPKQLEDGKVDYREIGLIRSVQKDELLARVIPPKMGIPGTTVEGVEIPPRQGAPVYIQPGRDTYFSDEQKQELRALNAGSVSLVQGLVHVDKTYIIPGNVDFSSGNVNFPGDVIVVGDVKAGFSVRAGGRIEVRGVVEDATLEAQGDILVKGGFEGAGRGLIRSGGCVHLKFIENQMVKAAGSVYIGEDALNSEITSEDTIYLNTGMGTVVGGHLRARKGLVAKVLGNIHNTPTTVEILQEEVKLAELECQGEKVSKQQAEMTGLYNALTILQQRRSSDKVHCQEIDAELTRGYERLKELKTELDISMAGLEALRQKMERAKNVGKVQVIGRIHPGVKVIIGGLAQSFEEERGKTRLEKVGLEIVVISLEKAILEGYMV